MNSSTEDRFRQEIVFAARRWLGTPFLHQASARGIGSDCLGLVRGVWRDVIGDEPQAMPSYGRDTVQLSGDRILFEALERYFCVASPDFEAVGDVLAFRLTRDASAQHVGITLGRQCGFPRMIHSYNRHGVVETPISEVWMRRCVGQFKFPRGNY